MQTPAVKRDGMREPPFPASETGAGSLIGGSDSPSQKGSKVPGVQESGTDTGHASGVGSAKGAVSGTVTLSTPKGRVEEVPSLVTAIVESLDTLASVVDSEDSGGPATLKQSQTAPLLSLGAEGLSAAYVTLSSVSMLLPSMLNCRRISGADTGTGSRAALNRTQSSVSTSMSPQRDGPPLSSAQGGVIVSAPQSQSGTPDAVAPSEGCGSPAIGVVGLGRAPSQSILGLAGIPSDKQSNATQPSVHAPDAWASFDLPFDACVHSLLQERASVQHVHVAGSCSSSVIDVCPTEDMDGSDSDMEMLAVMPSNSMPAVYHSLRIHTDLSESQNQ
ncbi:hypothetical protein KIPB_008259 [Kipferlia bialata]|uniref:Uncharacterized protein n=1 Tax=Kipferlia bialata TaxID=797122 RepID=A0A391NXH0_9EUKA|nr:hypothetical protein KIPB_008259 [Kipferlia bialata]|eukprot:g8259.t1